MSRLLLKLETPPPAPVVSVSLRLQELADLLALPLSAATPPSSFETRRDFLSHLLEVKLPALLPWLQISQLRESWAHNLLVGKQAHNPF